VAGGVLREERDVCVLRLGEVFVCDSFGMYEEAMGYFVRASYIQPKEKKWKLMVASCHRRVGASQQALQVQQQQQQQQARNHLPPSPPLSLSPSHQVYEAVEKEYPEDLECLTYLQVTRVV